MVKMRRQGVGDFPGEHANPVARFGRDEGGGVWVEVSVLLPILLIFVLGSVDFLFAFYQWNAAAKSVERGVRIAAVSSPVAVGLKNLTYSGEASFAKPLNIRDYKVTCSSASASCRCDRGTCSGVSGYDAAAMKTIIYGRGSSSCGDATSAYYAGMCDIFSSVAPNHVEIVYECRERSGEWCTDDLSYQGRKDGPVPTITVSLENLPFRFYFLGALMSFADIPNIPASATKTGEDLSSLGGP